MPVTVSRIIRSKRRTIALIVERDGSLTIRAPLKMAGQAIAEFVEKHAKWIEKKQNEVQAIALEPSRQYLPGEDFLFLGQSYPLEIVRATDQELVLEGTFKLADRAQRDAEKVFRSWYRQQAREIITERVARFAEKHHVHVGKIRITSAHTRWGSCSSKGTLSFSWRLITASPELIDYVIVHELAHTIHHNHSKRFWKLVEEWMPDYRKRRNQLRKHGQDAL